MRTICPTAGFQPSSSSTNVYQSVQQTDSAPYHTRDGVRLNWFGGKWWMTGGWSTNGPHDYGDGIPVYTTNEVWSSSDLISWTKELAHDASAPTSGAGARWLPRHCHLTYVHDGYLWVVNGDQYVKPIPSDVWRSSDGTTWERVAADAPFGAQGRSDGTSGCNGVYNSIPGYLGGEMYVIGGHRFTDLTTDHDDWPATAEVWRSSDGVTWTQLADAPFARGAVVNAVTLDDVLFVIGGNANTNNARSLKSDCWAFDGSTWQHMSLTSGGRWSARDYIGVAAFDSKLWVLTGFNGTANDGGCWWSKDFGRTWERAPYTHTASHADGIAVGTPGLAIAGGNSQALRTNLISIV